jgi:hypothetical protein
MAHICGYGIVAIAFADFFAWEIKRSHKSNMVDAK